MKKQALSVALVIVGFLLGATALSALASGNSWTPPNVPPPNGNIAAPINVGPNATTQEKTDSLLIDQTLGVVQNLIVGGIASTSQLRLGPTSVAGQVLTATDNQGTAAWQSASAGALPPVNQLTIIGPLTDSNCPAGQYNTSCSVTFSSQGGDTIVIAYVNTEVANGVYGSIDLSIDGTILSDADISDSASSGGTTHSVSTLSFRTSLNPGSHTLTVTSSFASGLTNRNGTKISSPVQFYIYARDPALSVAGMACKITPKSNVSGPYTDTNLPSQGTTMTYTLTGTASGAPGPYTSALNNVPKHSSGFLGGNSCINGLTINPSNSQNFGSVSGACLAPTSAYVTVASNDSQTANLSCTY